METNEISEQIDSIGLTAEAMEGNQSRLCEIWPVAKEALTLLEKVVTNIALKKLIRVIIDTGSAISGKICN